MNCSKRYFVHNVYFQGALVILVIAVIFSLGYLINSGVPAGSGGDTLSNAPGLLEYLKGPAYFFSNWSNTYSEVVSFGFFPGNLVLYLQFFLLLLTKELFLSLKLLQVAEIFCAGFFMFTCFYALTKHKFESIFAGALYMFAPFNLLRVQAHIYIAWSFAFIPLAYLAAYKTLTLGKWQYAVLAGLPFFCVLTFYPENIFLLAIPLLIFCFLIAFTYRKLDIRTVIKNILLIFIMFGMGLWMGLTSVILNFNFFFKSILSGSYPLIFASTGAYAYPNPPFSALMLFDGEILKMSTPLTQANVVLIVFSLSLLILSSICLMIKRSSLNISLFITGLICVIFSMGISAPSSLGLFNLAHKYLPYFDGITTPGRFIMTSYFAFVFLGVLGLRSIYEKMKSPLQRIRPRVRLKTRYFRILSIALLVVLIVVPAYLLSSTYSLDTLPLPPAAVQTQQLLNSYNPQTDYRALDLVSHNGILYILGQRTSTIGWDLVSRYYSSPSFAEILAKDNIKYIVASNSTDQFVLNGNLNQVLSNSPDFSKVNVDGCTIYINNLADPRIYAGSGALIVGGPNAISLLYALNDTANDIPLYAQQLLQEGMSLNQMINITDTLVFHDSDALDLAFMLINQTYLLQPWQYANSNWTIIQDNNGGDLPTAYLGSVDGQLNFAKFTIYTDKPSQIQIPSKIAQSGSYDIWIRAKSDTPWETWADPFDNTHNYRAFESPPLNNSISINMDGSSLGNVNLAQYGGFQWIEAGTVSLSAGTHQLQINTSDNPVYLDSVAIVPTGTVENELANVSDVLTASNKNSLYLLEFSNYFQLTGNATRADVISDYTSDSASGYVTLGEGGKAATSVYVAQAGNYSFQVRASNSKFNLLVDGTQLSLSSSAEVNSNTISNWTWYSGAEYLSQGYHNITVVATGSSVDLDMLSFQYSAQDNSSVPQLSYSQLGPSEWGGNITLNQPTQLVLTENIVPDWSLQLSTNNSVQTLQPNPAFYILNSYYINSTGTVSFKLNYSLPKIDNYAQNLEYVSFTIWVIVLLFTLVPVAKFIKKLRLKNIIHNSLHDEAIQRQNVHIIF